MSKRIGIATVYGGYNYGSALQAYATKLILSDIGYHGEIIKLKGSLVVGRDVRIKKLAAIAVRSVFHSGGMKSLKNYGDSVGKKMPEGAGRLFDNFVEKRLSPTPMSYGELKKRAFSDEYGAFICGSDQVWNSAVFYVDPFYYLRFAPRSKRIAFAPSFGRDFVPDYNKKKIAKYIGGFDKISVRESSGEKIVRELSGKDAETLVDPTLAVSAEEWTRKLHLGNGGGEPYLLTYFLDTPSAQTVEKIREISKKYNLKIVNLPYVFENYELGSTSVAGPREFVEYIKNASFVCTDSFHGTVFSINFNIPFYTFERNWGNAGKQSARIESILKLTDMTDRCEPSAVDGCMDISFEHSNRVLAAQRERSRSYLASAIMAATGCSDVNVVTDPDTDVQEGGETNVLSGEKERGCTGCGICAAVCPAGAIKIEENSEGFLRPVINESLCTACSLCTRVCYRYDDRFAVRRSEKHTSYGAVNKDERELRCASSGGVSAELMRECIRRGYYVAGVAYDVTLRRAVTRIARNEGELDQFRGSKYFQSNTAEAFAEIVRDKSDQKYAIFGTPCQIYAFSKLAEVKRNREKYIFVDIFCHGCPSITVWDKYLDYVTEKRRIGEIRDIKFRSKAHGWHEYAFEFLTDNGAYVSSKYSDPFHELFFGMDAMNEACYDCVARSTVEKTDIRIGDFWGRRHGQNTKGVSAVVISTDLGRELFESVRHLFLVEDADFDEIIKAQSYKKIHPYNEKRRRQVLLMLSSEGDISRIVSKRRKMLPSRVNLKRKFKSALKHLPTSLYNKLRNRLGG